MGVVEIWQRIEVRQAERRTRQGEAQLLGGAVIRAVCPGTLVAQCMLESCCWHRDQQPPIEMERERSRSRRSTSLSLSAAIACCMLHGPSLRPRTKCSVKASSGCCIASHRLMQHPSSRCRTTQVQTRARGRGRAAERHAFSYARIRTQHCMSAGSHILSFYPYTLPIRG